MICLAATGRGGVGVGGGIDPTNSQPGTVTTWMVSTTLRLLYSQERPGTHCRGGWLFLGFCLGGTVENITGRTFSKQQTKGPSVCYVSHLSISNACLQLQEYYLVLPTLLWPMVPSRAENLIVRNEIRLKNTVFFVIRLNDTYLCWLSLQIPL
jgi:hypothetical protein